MRAEEEIGGMGIKLGTKRAWADGVNRTGTRMEGIRGPTDHDYLSVVSNVHKVWTTTNYLATKKNPSGLWPCVK